MKASATASPNIALVKYWGKRDCNLNLPNNSSIGITLDTLEVHTTFELLPSSKQSSLRINKLYIDESNPKFDRSSTLR